MTAPLTNTLFSTAQLQASKVEPAQIASDAESQLASLLSAFSQWRQNKKQPSEAIPDQLFMGVFALETAYSAIVLRRIFNLTTQQYEQKRAKLWVDPVNASPPEQPSRPNPNNVTAASTDHATPSIAKPTLCEVKIKTHNPYALEPLASAKTLVVEFCRADGRVMKIHTTQDSIPTLIQNFFQGDAAC